MLYVYRVRSGSMSNGGIHTFEKAKEVLSTFIMTYREIIYLAELANLHVDMYYEAMFDKMNVNEQYAWGLNDEDKDTLGKYIEDCKEKINKFRIQKN